MKEKNYAYGVAYMKTFENKMLTKTETEALLDAPDLSAALKLLSDKGYGDARADDILKSELEKIWQEAKNACGEGAPLDILLYKNDFHNLKTILKAQVSGAGFTDLLLKPCIVAPKEIAEAIKRGNFESLPDFMREPAKKTYKLMGETRDGQSVEVFSDKACLLSIKERAEAEKSEFLIGWAELNILIANMKIAARAAGKSSDFIKNAMINTKEGKLLYEASLKSAEEVSEAISALGFKKGAELLLKSFSDFEKWCDNLKIEYVKKEKGRCFGFEPIFAFLIGKEFEIQTLRIILSGKENGIEKEIIRERLRESYV